jgi:hypothetical protein
MPHADGSIDYGKLPLSMRVGMLLYIEKGIRMGSFGDCLLAGDLYSAVAHADAENRYRIADIAEWLHMEAPPACFGTREAVEKWIDEKRKEDR